MVPTATSVSLAALCVLLAVSGVCSMPGGPWSPPRQVRHQQPPLHPPQPVQQLQELDPVDKCLFTCDYCYKQPKVLMACANECMMSAGDGSMGRVWLETCPYFAQPIYFDYQPV